MKMSLLYRHPLLFRLAGIPRVGKKKLRGEIGSMVGQNSTVFDVACGFGAMQKYLDPSCSYRGIDLNETFVRYGRERYRRDLWVQDCVHGPDYPQSDFIIVSDLLHHLATEKIKKVLGKAFKAARTVIVAEPSYLGLAMNAGVSGRLANWFFAAVDNDGINSSMAWRSEDEYRSEFEDCFGLAINDLEVEVSKIGLSLLAVYRLSDDTPNLDSPTM